MAISGNFDDDEPAHGAQLVGWSSDVFHEAASQELRSRVMSIQFAGSKSLDDRRRRRLVANSDDQGADEVVAEEGLPGGGLTSELVASEAAGPWVPVYEWRIWTYAALLGLFLLAAAFALSMPMAFRPELAPLTRQLLHGQRPLLAVSIQSTFWFLSAQLAVLIGWYRTQCKIDFRGRYRIWPWAAALFGLGAFLSATNLHGLLGQILQSNGVQLWRVSVIAWLVPAVSIAVPIIRLLDLDVRRSRSSLYTLRLAWILGSASAFLELFSVELGSFPWVGQTRIILPMVAAATLFVGLWLHARIVAYVCPDPPDPVDGTALVNLTTGWRWLASWILRPRAVLTAAPESGAEEEEVKPKRGRKKTTPDDEETAATKKKRRAPAKRAVKPRTRTKVADADPEAEEGEQEQYEEQGESTYESEGADSSSDYDMPAEESDTESSDWNEEPEQEVPATAPVPTKATTTANNQASKPSPVQQEVSEPSGGDDDEEAGDAILRRDSGMSADQFKGLSKRQKRELRKQARDQQRNQRH